MRNIIIGIVVLVAIGGSYFYLTQDKNIVINNTKKAINNNDNEEIGKKIMDEVNIADITKKMQNGELTDEEGEQAMIKAIAGSKTMNSEFEKQKAELPKYLVITKGYKACLEKADSKSDAKSCGEKTKLKAISLGLKVYDDEDSEEELGNWSSTDKTRVLSELKTDIIEMEKMETCYKTSKDMLGVMQCAGM